MVGRVGRVGRVVGAGRSRAMRSDEDDIGIIQERVVVDDSDVFEGGEGAVDTEGAVDAEDTEGAEGAVDALDAVGTRASEAPVVITTAPAPEAYPPGESAMEMWKTGALGVVALGALAGLGFFGHKTFKSQAPKVQQAMQDRQFAKESQQRLNDFLSQLRNQPTADLSAKNLGGGEDEGFCYVVDALSFNERLVAVDFSKNAIGSVGAHQLAQALASNTALQNIVMDTNNIGDEGASALASALTGGSQVKTLGLGSNGIGDGGVNALAEMLKGNTVLESIELNSNSIEDVSGLCEAIRVTTSLKRLNLSDNYVEDGTSLASALKENTSIEELVLSGNALGDEGVIAICEALKQRQGANLRTLELANVSISPEAMGAISDLVGACSTLETLNLSMNEWGDGGAFKLGTALEAAKSLVNLDCSAASLESPGAMALASGLKDHSNLKKLDLSQNPIGQAGVASVVDVLKHDMGIEVLKLAWCNNGENAEQIGQLIMYNTTIKELDLRGNGLKDNGMIWIARSLRESQLDLSKLNLAYNDIQDDGAVSLAQSLKHNPDSAPRDLNITSNMLTRMGQVALTEALDQVFDMAKREMVINF
jgi:Ran GTPase-activating protein (RanGAP) involved in mRNA processing and transport